MIRVTIELIPLGIGKPRTLGRVDIANTGEHIGEVRHNYVASFVDRNERQFRNAYVRDWPRNHRSIWQLLRRVFEEGVAKGE